MEPLKCFQTKEHQLIQKGSSDVFKKISKQQQCPQLSRAAGSREQKLFLTAYERKQLGLHEGKYRMVLITVLEKARSWSDFIRYRSISCCTLCTLLKCLCNLFTEYSCFLMDSVAVAHADELETRVA